MKHEPSKKAKAVVKEQDLHSQEWRDFQGFPEPDTTPENFDLALKRAEARIGRKRARAATTASSANE